MKHQNQTLSSYICHLLTRYKWFVSMLAIAGLIWAITNTLMPYLLKIIIDNAVGLEDTRSVFFDAVQPYILFYLLAWVILCLNMRFMDWIKLKLFPNIREDVISNNFEYLNQHAYQYFQNNFSGGLITKIFDLQGGVVDIITILNDCYTQIIGLLIASITLFVVHPLFALILLSWVTAFFSIAFYFLKPVKNLSRSFAEARSALVGTMVDSISNIINVRLFAKNDYENKYINQMIAGTIQKNRNMMSKIIKMRLLLDLSLVIFLSCNLFLLARMYGQHLVTVGDFSFIIILSMSIFFNIFSLAGQLVNFSEQAGKCNQALSVLNTAHNIVDQKNALPLKITAGKIQFKGVGFYYKEGARLFQNKNIDIHSGEKIGLVGLSGSGKSTFVNLILRLFEVVQGEITIDNQNINRVTQASLRENIAFVPQDISLFHRSLMDNIRYGRTDATDTEVIDIAKKAYCDEFISKLDHGYQSIVGERGIKLSGGQRQRIAIARAMLKNARILIMDEATSALDSVTEKYVQDALHHLMQDKTAIFIAHRLSTLSKMDRIFVFDNGVIIENGTHDQLIQLNGHYAKMWRMQAGGFLPDTSLLVS